MSTTVDQAATLISGVPRACLILKEKQHGPVEWEASRALAWPQPPHIGIESPVVSSDQNRVLKHLISGKEKKKQNNARP